jgi:hypothetical protein
VEEISERIAALNSAGLVNAARNRLQHPGADQHHVRIAKPEIHQQNHRASAPRIGFPLGRKPEHGVEKFVHRSELLVE